jgi:alpha-methylacyl-CoA racemase
MERLGLGPDVCMQRKPSLVYGRMTGWGQDGPLARAAGHDPNYIALAGVLHTIGRRNEPPTLPLNLVGDFGGGGLLLAFGLVCGILEARSSGQGQVIDAAMVDGAATLATLIYALKAQGRYVDERESNFLDGGAHFNQVYETSDGKYVSICSLEPQFYDELVRKLDLDAAEFAGQMDRDSWPAYRVRLTALFKKRTRAEWCEILEGSDVCFAPVLSLTEAPNHPHNLARGTFIEHDGFIQPAPAPRFSRTPGHIQSPSRPAGSDSEALLAELGFSPAEVQNLKRAEVVAQAPAP